MQEPTTPKVWGQITRNDVTLPAIQKQKRAKKGEQPTEYVGMPDIKDDGSNLMDVLKFYGLPKAIRRFNGMLNQTWEGLYDKVTQKVIGKEADGSEITEDCEFEFPTYAEAVQELHDRTWEGETIGQLTDKLQEVQDEYSKFLSDFDPANTDVDGLMAYKQKAAEYIAEIKEIRVAINDRSRKKKTVTA